MGLLRAVPVQLGLAWLCALAAACTGGQSGTETPKPVDDASTPPPRQDATDAGHTIKDTVAAVPCQCIAQPGALVLRATLQSVAACALSARVQRVLAPDGASLQPGAVVSGVPVSAGVCGHGLELAPGDDVLLVYAPAAAGVTSQVVVARYADPLVFGYAGKTPVTLPQADVDSLLDLAACSARFTQPADAGGETPVCDPAPGR